MGLKALIYLRSLETTKEWDGQSPPTPRHQIGKPVIGLQEVLEKVTDYFCLFVDNLCVHCNLF